MKKVLLFGLFIFITVSCCSCSNDSRGMTSVVNPSVSPVSSSDASVDTQPQTLVSPRIIVPASTTNDIVYAVNSEGMICIYDGKKYGFVNEYGDKSIPFIYDKAHPFSEGRACVYSDGKYGFIDNKGTTVIPFIYDKASSFHEGLAYFEIGEQYGFIDENGNQVFLLDCDSVSSFNEGLAYFSINGEYGYINKAGKVAINPIYDDAGYFKNRVAKVRVNDKMGIIDKNGQEIVPINYDDVYTEDGVINFSINDKSNSIDENGNAIKIKYSNFNKVPNSNLSIAEVNYKYGIVDSVGKVIVPFKYDGIYYANNQADTGTYINRFSVRRGDKGEKNSRF